MNKLGCPVQFTLFLKYFYTQHLFTLGRAAQPPSASVAKPSAQPASSRETQRRTPPPPSQSPPLWLAAPPFLAVAVAPLTPDSSLE